MHVMLTKSDKLKRGAAQNALLSARKQLEEIPGLSVQLFSSLQKSGVETLVTKLDEWLLPDAPPTDAEPVDPAQ
jgi:GTP-binding protein